MSNDGPIESEILRLHVSKDIWKAIGVQVIEDYLCQVCNHGMPLVCGVGVFVCEVGVSHLQSACGRNSEYALSVQFKLVRKLTLVRCNGVILIKVDQ